MISNQLEKYRKERGLNIARCAEAVGVSQSTYRDWENGRSISGEPYLKIAEIFGISVSELFGLNPKELSINLTEIETGLNNLINHINTIRSGL